MKLEITEKKNNQLLGRTEVTGKLVFEGATPSNEVVRDTVAAELKVGKELVVVKQIKGKFSYQEAEFLAYIYADKAAMDKMEVVTKAMKKKSEEGAKTEAEGKKEEEKKEEKAAGEEKEEKAEEKKEE